jgi:hypothetical protein
VAVLHAEPLGWASFGVRILCGDEELTQLTISAFKSKGSFDLGGETFTVEPEGFFRSHAILKKGGSTLARVRKPSLLRRRFEISSAGHRLILENRGWRGREYVLLLGTQEVGSVKREGFSGRKLLLEFPDDVPDFLQVLLAYVVVSQAKREAAAAAAGG